MDIFPSSTQKVDCLILPVCTLFTTGTTGWHPSCMPPTVGGQHIGQKTDPPGLSIQPSSRQLGDAGLCARCPTPTKLADGGGDCCMTGDYGDWWLILGNQLKDIFWWNGGFINNIVYKWWIAIATFDCLLCPKSAIFVEINIINNKHEGVKYELKRDWELWGIF